MLIQNSKQIADDTAVKLAIADIVEQEYAKERAECELRDANARWVAQNLHSNKTIPALGKCIAVVPMVDDIRLHAKYGKHVFEKSFWRYYQKHNPESCPSKI